jgi:hypothetical protein
MRKTSSVTHKNDLHGATKAGRCGFFAVLTAENAFGDELDAALRWGWNVLTHWIVLVSYSVYVKLDVFLRRAWRTYQAIYSCQVLSNVGLSTPPEVSAACSAAS